MHQPPIQKADSKKRTAAILLVIGAGILGAALLSRVELLQDWVVGEPDKLLERVNWLIGGLLILAVPLQFICWQLWTTGNKVIDTARFPPPGVPVVRDTVILEGDAAINRGRLLRFTAVFLSLSSVLLPVVTWYMVWKITGAL